MSRYDIRWKMLRTNVDFWVIVVCFSIAFGLMFWRGDA